MTATASTPLLPTIDLAHARLGAHGALHRNLPPAVLVEHALARGEGKLGKGGAFVTRTGKYTGRSPDDKFVVRDANTEATIWWDNNKAFTPAQFDHLHDRVAAYLQHKDLYVQDCFAGQDPTHRLSVRVIAERAWHALFANNMFIRPSAADLAAFAPDFTVLHAPGFKCEPARDGTFSEAAIVLDFTRKMVIITGSEYAGEMKKSIFTVLNYVLPAAGVMSMHCSANIGNDGATAVFFGLSGTGKTTLSADPERGLIGDDEHGWSGDGVFNFEGGCYAKMIKLSPTAEPEIYATTARFGTILENVVMDEATRELDLDSAEYTENTRGSYEIGQIPNAVLSGRGGHPTDIIMLTADAFGILPPLARLTPAQAMFHFLSGYTAKVAGTERGVTEPKAAFSSCFGAPFMARHPTVYAKLLGELIAKHGVRCWLVNTGWTGGAYGVGKRMSIQHTRRLLHAALSGELNDTRMVAHPNFKFGIPAEVAGIPSDILDTRNTWSDKAAYDAKAKDLIERFNANFAKFAAFASDEVKAAAPTL
ncbi:MAG: phosphoenolpyruvate carboxykinase [Deltaproteobacteria bacterium]|nr:phosphoenolpyruvate carboxykinase [Deltaproteobacteria bacterium]